jgi:hypothetical protein
MVVANNNIAIVVVLWLRSPRCVLLLPSWQKKVSP